MVSKFLSLLGLAALASLVNAEARTSAPSGCVTVGSSGKYSTVQAAVDAAPSCIFISAGTYSEQVYIEAGSAITAIYGETSDTSSYSNNKVTITAGHSQAEGLSDDATGTLRAHNDGLQVYNINIVNSYGQGSQAIALSAYGSEQGYYGVQITGYQDTLLAEQGYQLYVNSYIEGAVDFIFGQEGVAWFENCDIYTIGAGAVTASGRDSESNPSYYVINNSNIDGSAGSGVNYLGRPWRDYARVIVQNTALSDVINSAGWEIWNTGDDNTDHVTFEEYGNTGSGASGTRASFSSKASSPLEMSSILSGYTSWADASYL